MGAVDIARVRVITSAGTEDRRSQMRRKIGLNRLLAIARWSLVAVALSSVGFVTNPIGAEEPDTGAVATFFEPINVPLVSVDIVVTNRQGRPIEGLTQDDFEVFEDGRPMDITHFYAAGERGVLRHRLAFPRADRRLSVRTCIWRCTSTTQTSTCNVARWPSPASSSFSINHSPKT